MRSYSRKKTDFSNIIGKRTEILAKETKEEGEM